MYIKRTKRGLGYDLVWLAALLVTCQGSASQVTSDANSHT